MRVKNKLEIRQNYNFEGRFVSASSITKRAEKLIEGHLDLLEYLAPEPDSLYMVRVNGESMKDEGINDGDILIVDKKAVPKDGLVVIAALNGEMLVKTYRVIDNYAYLFSANDKFLPIKIMPLWDLTIQGVVRHVIKNL